MAERKHTHSKLPWIMEYTMQGKQLEVVSERHRMFSCWDVEEAKNHDMWEEEFANAELIVKACNSHYDLVDALRAALFIYQK